jgi:hypothetical protein
MVIGKAAKSSSEQAGAKSDCKQSHSQSHSVEPPRENVLPLPHTHTQPWTCHQKPLLLLRERPQRNLLTLDSGFPSLIAH